MSLRIYCRDEHQPVPRDVLLELSCDGAHDDLFTVPARAIYDANDFPAARSLARAEGWIVRDTPQGPKFIGPCCTRRL